MITKIKGADRFEVKLKVFLVNFTLLIVILNIKKHISTKF